MGDLNSIAKRIHNIAPNPVLATLDDGTEAVFHFEWVEFFQQEFKAEGSRVDDEGAEYRLISSEDNEAILVGRKGPADDGWAMTGEIVSATRAEE